VFTLNHSVSSRIAKYTYGIESCTTYDPKSAAHRARERTSFRARSGELMMPKSFLAILEKVHFTHTLNTRTTLLIFKPTGYRGFGGNRV
jgi:hypothetical protein